MECDSVGGLFTIFRGRRHNPQQLVTLKGKYMQPTRVSSIDDIKSRISEWKHTIKEIQRDDPRFAPRDDEKITILFNFPSGGPCIIQYALFGVPCWGHGHPLLRELSASMATPNLSLETQSLDKTSGPVRYCSGILVMHPPG